MEKNRIVVINFGGQYVRLIARSIRSMGAYCEIVSPDLDIEYLKSSAVKGIILSGGPASTDEKGAPGISRELFELDKPVLGICYGMQLMAGLLVGGRTAKNSFSEYGRANLEIVEENKLLAGMASQTSGDLTVWMSHGDSVVETPSDFQILASTPKNPVAALADTNRDFYGVQFHPEVEHTEGGKKILSNFVFSICKMEKNWQIGDVVSQRIDEIQDLLDPGDRVLIGLSGGVDSSVTAALIEEALGEDRLRGIFVDHGLLRKKEADRVISNFKDIFSFPIHCLDASERFLDKLEGVSEPEEKRNIIGEEFIRVFEQKADELEDINYLAQGTIYSDVIESGLDQNAALIKSHHNVGGLPEKMELDLLEPLREFFKDEVREIGTHLGLPQELVNRQPFPGPGLAIRIIGEVERTKLNILRQADYILREELENFDSSDDIWQAFAVLPDIRSVGVQGDTRTYGYPIILRVVNSKEAMTADWVRLPHELLDRIAGRIVDEVREINRVAYDISSKPPATIEWE